MDVERTIQFILDQQAQFSGSIVQVNTVLLEIATTQERTNAILATLAERQVRTEQAIDRLVDQQKITEQSIARLADQQKTTEQTLNILLITVDRHIANHK